MQASFNIGVIRLTDNRFYDRTVQLTLTLLVNYNKFLILNIIQI